MCLRIYGPWLPISYYSAYAQRVHALNRTFIRKMSILDGSSLDMHIGLADRKRVNVVGIKVTKTVIDETVAGVVSSERTADRTSFSVVFSGRRQYSLAMGGATTFSLFQQFFLAKTAPSRALHLHAYTSPRPLPRGSRRNCGKFSVRRYMTGLMGESEG